MSSGNFDERVPSGGNFDEQASLLPDFPSSPRPEDMISVESQPIQPPPGSEVVNAQTTYESKPWKYKLLAFVCSCLLSIGSHFAAQMLGALKNTLKEVRLASLKMQEDDEKNTKQNNTLGAGHHQRAVWVAAVGSLAG